MELTEILGVAIRVGASDIHLKPGLPPMFRVNGELLPLKDGKRLAVEDLARFAAGMFNDFQRERYARENEVDLGYNIPGLGRFRVNIFQQRGVMGIVLRVIPLKIQSIRELLLPPEIEKIAVEPRGLVLVTGTTGSGKSTTLAAMLDHINSRSTKHVMTIEDPIEFIIRDKASIINQREIGFDTHTFSKALRSALRQDPDIIMVGEMRDLETIETALIAASTGHMVLSTLHTIDATETVNRIVSIFPPHQQKQVRIQLASNLRAVISQRLVSRADGKGRTVAVEVMKMTSRIRELVEDKDRTREIPEAIAAGHTTYGMQTFDQSLMKLAKEGLITYDEALSQATNPDDFSLRFQGVISTSDNTWDSFEKPPTTSPSSAAISVKPPARPTAQQRTTPATTPRTTRPTLNSGSLPGPVYGQSEEIKDPTQDSDDFQVERF